MPRLVGDLVALVLPGGLDGGMALDVRLDGMPIADSDIITPSKKVNETLVIKEWDNVLRILASLALKKTTQSQIVRKLSSYTKTNPTLNALIAFDEIITLNFFYNFGSCVLWVKDNNFFTCQIIFLVYYV